MREAVSHVFRNSLLEIRDRPGRLVGKVISWRGKHACDRWEAAATMAAAAAAPSSS